jgi:hypothetical protein
MQPSDFGRWMRVKTTEGASRAAQEDGNECLLLCVNAKRNAAIAVQTTL